MIKLIVKTTTVRNKEVVTDLSDTPASVFEKLGVSTAGASITLDGRFINGSLLNKSFAELDIKEGAVAYLNNVVKSDGGNI